jgi:hypothetical protein
MGLGEPGPAKSPGDGVRDLERLAGRVCLRWSVLGVEICTYLFWTDRLHCSLCLRDRKRERESGKVGFGRTGVGSGKGAEGLAVCLVQTAEVRGTEGWFGLSDSRRVRDRSWCRKRNRDGSDALSAVHVTFVDSVGLRAVRGQSLDISPRVPHREQKRTAGARHAPRECPGTLFVVPSSRPIQS